MHDCGASLLRRASEINRSQSKIWNSNKSNKLSLCPHILNTAYILQKQSCCFSKVFGYYNCMTIFTTQILWMQYWNVKCMIVVLLYWEEQVKSTDHRVRFGIVTNPTNFHCALIFWTLHIYCKNKVVVLAKYLVTTIAWLSLLRKFYECSTGKEFMQCELMFE